MLVLITYDVNTEDAAGRKRLRQIAKKCMDYGQRVQNSVFECLLDAGQCRRLQAQLLSIMDPEKDSLRFYYLGKQYEKKVEHLGAKITYLPEDPLIKVTSNCREVRKAFPEKAPVFPRFSRAATPCFPPKNAKILLICQRSAGKTVHLCCRPPRGGVD